VVLVLAIGLGLLEIHFVSMGILMRPLALVPVVVVVLPGVSIQELAVHFFVRVVPLHVRLRFVARQLVFQD
jgi:hypothetical protein